jgi:hypothetical protein
MQQQEFKIIINAPRAKVWNALWDRQNYREWTKAFHEDSDVITDGWKKGSVVHFGDSQDNGMISEVEENIPNEFMSFKHLGEIRNGVEDRDSDKVKEWAGAHENYTLKDIDGKTELTINMDINEKFAEMFAGIWPKALENVKNIAER